jgi:hypothetical protein
MINNRTMPVLLPARRVVLHHHRSNPTVNDFAGALGSRRSEGIPVHGRAGAAGAVRCCSRCAARSWDGRLNATPTLWSYSRNGPWTAASCPPAFSGQLADGGDDPPARVAGTPRHRITGARWADQREVTPSGLRRRDHPIVLGPEANRWTSDAPVAPCQRRFAAR